MRVQVQLVDPHRARERLALRRACYGVLRFIMESGAKGCEVIVSGKLRAQRAKAMKFKDGFMISSGNPVHDYIDGAVRHVMLRQGVLGIKVWLPRSARSGGSCLAGVVPSDPDCHAFVRGLMNVYHLAPVQHTSGSLAVRRALRCAPLYACRRWDLWQEPRMWVPGLMVCSRTALMAAWRGRCAS